MTINLLSRAEDRAIRLASSIGPASNPPWSNSATPASVALWEKMQKYNRQATRFASEIRRQNKISFNTERILYHESQIERLKLEIKEAQNRTAWHSK